MKTMWVGFLVLTVITSISYEIFQNKNLPKITHYKEKNNLVYCHHSIFGLFLFTLLFS